MGETTKAPTLQRRGLEDQKEISPLSTSQDSAALAILGGDPATELDRASDPAAFVLLALERSKAWLAEVLSVGGIEDIVELKSQAEAIRVYTRQKQLGKDSELAATEIVRRAERGIGLAIRRGQEMGQIRGKQPPVAEHVAGAHGAISPSSRGEQRDGKRSPSEFFGNGQERVETYALTDGVSEDEFEDALTDARQEGNLSRSNVIAKVRELPSYSQQQADKWSAVATLSTQGLTSAQIARRVDMSEQGLRAGASKRSIAFPADGFVGKARRINSVDLIEKSVVSLEATASVLPLAQFEGISSDQALQWLDRIEEPLRAIRRMAATLKEISQ